MNTEEEESVQVRGRTQKFEVSRMMMMSGSSGRVKRYDADPRHEESSGGSVAVSGAHHRHVGSWRTYHNPLFSSSPSPFGTSTSCVSCHCHCHCQCQHEHDDEVGPIHLAPHNPAALPSVVSCQSCREMRRQITRLQLQLMRRDIHTERERKMLHLAQVLRERDGRLQSPAFHNKCLPPPCSSSWSSASTITGSVAGESNRARLVAGQQPNRRRDAAAAPLPSSHRHSNSSSSSSGGGSNAGSSICARQKENPHIRRGMKGFVEFPRPRLLNASSSSHSAAVANLRLFSATTHTAYGYHHNHNHHHHHNHNNQIQGSKQQQWQWPIKPTTPSPLPLPVS